LPPPPPDLAIAGEASEVERSMVMVGGTSREYFPQAARKERRSLSPCDPVKTSGFSMTCLRILPLPRKYRNAVKR
jgi:hypothetical protein